MSTITISLPDHLVEKVDNETKKGGFATRSEFIRDLLRRLFYHENKFEVFSTKPLLEVEKDLKKTGKYSGKFIKSVISGLSRSSVYEG